MAVVGKLIKKSISYRKKALKIEQDAVKQQYKTFRKLIKKAEATEFGKQFLFSQILTAKYDIGLFQNLVPVYSYEKINLEWWRKMRYGLADVCWPGSIKYFALSSGTSDASSKYIPVSKQMLKSIRKTSMRQIYSMANYDLSEETFEKQILMIGGSASLTEKDEKYFGDMSGISVAHAMPNWFSSQYFKPGYEIASIPEWNDRVEAIVQNAKDWDISIVCGIPNWVQMIFEKIVERYNVKTIHDIWPHLEIYVHGGIFFDPYKQTFKSLLGKEIIYAETYMASEGYFGFTEYEHADGIQLIFNNGIFYEFIPFDEKYFDEQGNVLKGAPVFTIADVEPDVEYAILISNNSGAWRYLLGDVIKFVNVHEHTIKIIGRTKHYLSVCDEHLSIDNMTTAFQNTCEELNMHVNEFTVMPMEDKQHFAHKWYIGSSVLSSPEIFAKRLDKHLNKVNDDYKAARNSILGMPKVEFIPTQLFYEWLSSMGKEGNQFKIPRVLKGDSLESWIRFLENAVIEVKK
ncbi:MAG: GH3 auxin-responsive promoter family protein [Fimbriimonadaceae bacterium]|nr:GH3 auxin-responsive promoter family protein [Chitinophagales bacterium]